MSRVKANFLASILAAASQLAAGVGSTLDLVSDLERFSKTIRPMPRSRFKRFRLNFGGVKPHQSWQEKTRRIAYMARGGDAGQDNMARDLEKFPSHVRPGKSFNFRKRVAA